MGRVDQIENSLEMLGGVASLKEIYIVANKFEKTPEPSIRARIYENCKILDAYKGKDLFGSIYGKGEGVFSLKKYFKNDEDAKFIYELKQQRLKIWDKLKKKKKHSNSIIKKMNIHKGERGIYRDVNKTRFSIFKDGLTLSILDTGKIYDDVLTDTHLTYYYPDTATKNRDIGEVNSLKNIEKYNIPIFVVLGLAKDRSNKEIRLGYVKNHNDSQKNFLIEFKINKEQILSPKFEKIIEEQEEENENSLVLFINNFKGKTKTSIRRSNNQQLFNSNVFKYYDAKCAVCDLEYSLDAAHIIPVSNKGTDHKRNGLILCKNHHKAFDDNFFKINPKTMKIEFFHTKTKLRITKNNLNHLNKKPAKVFLEWRYKNYKI